MTKQVTEGLMTGNGNIDTHRATYNFVLGLLKYGAGISAILAFIVILLIKP